MKERWFIKNRQADFSRISNIFNIPDYLSRILVNRGIDNPRAIDAYLNPDFSKMYNPALMKDMDKASEIIINAINKSKKIRIVGDYDVDGVISVYMLKNAIDKLGGNVDYVIPDRIEDGYGINKSIIGEAKEDGVDLIITCDNGIAAIDEVDFAKSIGLEVIVTDHHDLPFKEIYGETQDILVQADAVLNPKRRDCSYPFKMLCGAGVVYKLIENIYKDYNIIDEARRYIEYAAIATICDVVDLVDENRIIVKKGLEMINSTSNIGLKSLIRATELTDKEISVYHIGFILGPSINASGRLDSAEKALELFLTDDIFKAELLAKELRELNDDRKDITIKGTDKVIEQVENTSLKNDSVLLIYEPTIHESVAGIIAGRIKDRYYKPTIVITNSGELAKGSARSIEEFDIFKELSDRKYYLEKFGGHPMAAGLSLKVDNISKLRESLNNNSLTEEDLAPKIYLDMPLKLSDINYELVYNLEKLEPFGKGNSKPIFGVTNIDLAGAKVLGKNKNVIKLQLLDENNRIIEGMIFNGVEDFENVIVNNYGSQELEKLYSNLENSIKLDLVFYPNINEFMGRTTLQIIIESYRISK